MDAAIRRYHRHDSLHARARYHRRGREIRLQPSSRVRSRRPGFDLPRRIYHRTGSRRLGLYWRIWFIKIASQNNNVRVRPEVLRAITHREMLTSLILSYEK